MAGGVGMVERGISGAECIKLPRHNKELALSHYTVAKQTPVPP